MVILGGSHLDSVTRYPPNNTVNDTPPPSWITPDTTWSCKAVLPDHRHRGHDCRLRLRFQDSTGHDAWPQTTDLNIYNLLLLILCSWIHSTETAMERWWNGNLGSTIWHDAQALITLLAVVLCMRYGKKGGLICRRWAGFQTSSWRSSYKAPCRLDSGRYQPAQITKRPRSTGSSSSLDSPRFGQAGLDAIPLQVNRHSADVVAI